jgi:GDP-4-dehydro-6-deoxy-D-mannose reductase
MKVLITGMEGFAGSHLAEYALGQGAAVHRTAFPGASQENLAGLRVVVHPLDITSAPALAALLRRLRPERIFHLAGKSSPAVSRKDPETTLRVNIQGTLNILEAAVTLPRRLRVLVVGSADEYGCVDRGVARTAETHPLNPETPYAVSKVCQDLLTLAYYRDRGLHGIRVRPFNHIGPRQALGFVATDFASQIAAIEHRQKPPVVSVGNLEVIRDFSDVRDIVRGYWDLLESGKPGEVYNLGSGRGVRVRALLEGLLALSPAGISVRMKREKIRSEKLRKVADIAKARHDCGWRPEIPLSRTLKDILEDWRGRAEAG